MAMSYDVIIIGGGHHGLVCGTYLAKAGLKALVLERRSIFGGAAVTQEFAPGFKTSSFSYVMSLLHPRVILDLELAKFGLEVLPANDLFCPLYGEFSAYLEEVTKIVRALLLETPVDPTRRDWRTFKETASLLWRHRRIGGKFYRIVDLMTQSAYDYLSAWFESDIIKAVLAYYASIGTFAGPKSPGSAYVIMHHIMGEHAGAGGWGFIRGGMGGITQAIAASGRRFGLAILTDAAVEKVTITDGHATGVRTVDGRELMAKTVVSNANCKTLFERLVDRRHLPDDLLADIARFRTFSTAFKLNVAAERPPHYRAFDKAKAGFDYPNYVHIAPDIDYLERAYDDAKYGWYSMKPFVTPVVPTIVDDTLAPPGKHVINAFGGHAPYKPKNGLWENERDKFVNNVIGVVDEFAPGFSSGIIDMQLLLPPDLEEILDLPERHIFHGELSADQLFFQRPVPHYADYRTPIAGLYQCGSSCHPGGGVSGIPGHNAAREILKDLKRRPAGR